MSNNLRTRDGLPFNFEDGLKVKGVELSSPNGAAQVGTVLNNENTTVADALIELNFKLQNQQAGAYSSAGKYWTIRSIPEGVVFNDVIWVPITYTTGRFIGVSDDSIYTSHDGISWISKHTSPSQVPWSSIAHSPYFGTIVVVGKPDTNDVQIMISEDNGNNWTVSTPPTYPVNHTRSGDITLGNWNSITWSEQLGFFIVTSDELDDDGNGIFIKGEYVSDPVYSFVWTYHTSPNIRRAAKVIWAGEPGIFVAVGVQAEIGAISTSPDGINWTNRPTEQLQFSSIAWSPTLSLFVAVGMDFSTIDYFGIISTSPDGINWTNVVTNSRCSLLQVTWADGPNIFVAIGTGADRDGLGLIYSKDGINWINVSLPLYPDLKTISWSPDIGRFFSSGQYGNALTSP